MTDQDVLALVREKLEAAGPLPWEARPSAHFMGGHKVHNARFEVIGMFVLASMEMSPNAQLAVLAVNALEPLVEALVNKPCGCGDDGIPIHNCGAAACRRCKALADLRKQLQQEKASD